MNKQVHEVVDHYVHLALEAKKNPEKKGDRYIFRDALAEETDNPKALRDEMLNILLAGRDTTASLLSSTFFYLSRNPESFNKLRQAIVKEFGDAKNPTGEITQTKLKDIPYLRHVLNESKYCLRLALISKLTNTALRLMPPVPVNFRVATKDTSLPTGGGPDRTSPVYVKKGTIVAYSVYTMHRRPDFYGPDPNTFRPERWEENTRRGWDFLPFNGGPRICLGRMYFPVWLLGMWLIVTLEQYALTEASYTVARLMQHFDKLENADTEVASEPIKHSSLTMSHDRGVTVRLSPIA